MLQKPACVSCGLSLAQRLAIRDLSAAWQRRWAHVLLRRVHPRISHCLVAPPHRGEPGAGLLEVAASRDAYALRGRLLGPYISQMMSCTLNVVN